MTNQMKNVSIISKKIHQRALKTNLMAVIYYWNMQHII